MGNISIDSLTIGQAKELLKIFGGLAQEPARPRNPAIGKYCILRCRNAGVHAGIIEEANAEFVVLKDSRRLWFWKSKFTLSEAAITGIESGSKIAAPLERLIIPASDAAEFLPTSAKARKSIEEAETHVP